MQNQPDFETQMSTSAEDNCHREAWLTSDIGTGMVFQLADGTISGCNATAEKILGFTREQMLSRTSFDQLWQTIHEDSSPFIAETHPTTVALQTGQPVVGVVMRVYQPNGNLVWIKINAQPLFKVHSPIPWAAVASFWDITLQKQAELERESLLHLKQATHRNSERANQIKDGENGESMGALQAKLAQSLVVESQGIIKRERVVMQIAACIRQSLDLEVIFNTTVQSVREFLQTDRVLIFRLMPDGSGTVVSESVGIDWVSILSTKLFDPCFNQSYIEAFRRGLVTSKTDIHNSNIRPCHVEFLSQFQVQANLVVPILQGENLWGLLIAHHCSQPRQWPQIEIDLLKQLAIQVAKPIDENQLITLIRQLVQQKE